MQLNFWMFLLLVPACIYSFNLIATDNLDCKPSNLQCLSNTTFTTCVNGNNVTYLVNQIYTCPDGHYCNDDGGKEPCIKESTTVVRPTTPPTCNDSNIDYVQAAAACNQYYKCTKVSILFVTYYEAKLTNCNDGLVFSITQSACVNETESDCP